MHRPAFYINRHHLKLHGWDQKPTDEWPGLEQPDWVHFFTVSFMKEAGGNFIRWGHCASGPAMIASSDRLGLVVDQPGVNGGGDAQPEPWNTRAAAFRDAIIYFRNNPSILIWEGGNQKVTRAHAKELRGYMDQYDPHGGRAYAHQCADEITALYMSGSAPKAAAKIASLPVVEGEYDREEPSRRVGRRIAADLRVSGSQGPDLSAHLGAVCGQPGGAVREKGMCAEPRGRRQLDVLRFDQRRPRGRGGGAC
jgi:beta-galactosidase